jgi:hypothetical protein
MSSKNFFLLACYDIYKPDFFRVFKFLRFLYCCMFGCLQFGGGGDTFFSESGQLSIHEERLYVILSCFLIPTHSYLTTRRGPHADQSTI